jgi:hypothetical protein
MLLEELGEFECWEAHRNAQGLGFVRAGNDTTIVIRKDHHRLPQQGRLKKPLTGDVEVITI